MVPSSIGVTFRISFKSHRAFTSFMQLPPIYAFLSTAHTSFWPTSSSLTEQYPADVGGQCQPVLTNVRLPSTTPMPP